MKLIVLVVEDLNACVLWKIDITLSLAFVRRRILFITVCHEEQKKLQQINTKTHRLLQYGTSRSENLTLATRQ